MIKISNPFVFASLNTLFSLQQQARHIRHFKTKQPAISGTGENPSALKSRGLDFQEVRHYQPGDDVRQIDWRLTAKYGKPFTKLYADEKAHRVFILSDLRTRMKFASRGSFKSVICAKISAFLTWLAADHKDILSALLLMPETLRLFPKLSKTDEISLFLKTLSRATDPLILPQDTTPLSKALETVYTEISGKSVIFIISDFQDIDSKSKTILKKLQKKNLLIFIHIYDQMETELPKGYLPVSNGKESFVFNALSPRGRDLFQASFLSAKEELMRFVTENQIHYLPIRTDDDSYVNRIRFYCERI